MPSQPDVLQSCAQEAAKAARPALERCIDEAVAVLQDAESRSLKAVDRDSLARASRELLKHKPGWAMQYPADLLVIFKANTAAAVQAARAPVVQPDAAPPVSVRAPLQESGFFSHSNFSLVEDADVSQAIESARLQQQVMPPVEQILTELNTLISTLQGLPNVRPELNPLRPEAFMLALKNMVAASAAEPAMAALWLKHMANPLGRELKQLYELLVKQLESANVQGASYRVLQTPANASRGRAGTEAGASRASPLDAEQGRESRTGQNRNGQSRHSGFGPLEPQDADKAEALAPSQYADLSDFGIRDELFQDFLFYGGAHADQGLAPSYYKAVDDELAALHGELESVSARLAGYYNEVDSAYQNAPAVDRPQRFVDERSHLSPQAWGDYAQPRQRAIVRAGLKKEATRVGQVLGLEVVRKLVNQVAQDARLLVPVREAIVALEPALLRLAMIDPRFFSDEGHPGRRIMERVAQRSFKYNDEFGEDFLAFFEPVRAAFNELNHLEITDDQPFAAALAGLETGWDEQDQQESKNRNNVLQALKFAEERQQQADQIAFDLSARSDLENVPGLVLDFLFGPWALAMAHAKLTDTRNQVDPLGFGSVVPDLLWSVKRDITLKRPAKLIEMIPSLLTKLHAGLELLGQEPGENEAFFEGLMKLHRPVLRLRRMKSQQDAEESGAVPLEPEPPPATPEQRRAKAAAHPWLGRDDLDAAGFEDTVSSEPGELAPLDDDYNEAPVYMDGRPAGTSPADFQAPINDPGAWEATADPLAAEAVEAAEAAQDAARLATFFGVPVGTSAPVANVPAAASSTVTVAPFEASQIVLSLRTGSWVDLYSRRQWLRAQLIWASTKGTLFMFVSHGGQPHSMTKRSCERLIRERLLRPVDTHEVVAQALDAVASEVAATAAENAAFQPEYQAA